MDVTTLMCDMIDEIGLCGLEGCTPDELWDHLSCRHHQPPSVIDTGMKSFLWGQLLNCTSLMKLYHIPRPAPLQGPLNQLLLPDGTTRWNEYLPVHQYMYISEEGGKIKGSCSTYCERRDITDEILSLSPDEQSLTKIHEKYGERRVVIVGSQSCRERSLISPHVNPSHVQLGDWRYGLMEIVGKSRRNGIFRNHLTKTYLKIDARSTFHHVKILQEMGVVNIKVYTLKYEKGGGYQQIHIVFLKRFTPGDLTGNMCNPHHKLFTDLLQNSPNGTLPVTELSKSLGKHYKKTRHQLLHNGCIEEVVVKGDPDDNDSRPVRSLRLVTTPVESKPTCTSLEIKAESEDEEEEGGGTVPLVAELSLDMQGFRIIDDRRDKGIMMREFQLKTFPLSGSLSRLVAKSLIKSKIVTTIMIGNSSVRAMNLISTKHLKNSKQVEDFNAEYSKGNTECSSAIRTGMNVFHSDDTDRKSKRKRTKSNEAVKIMKLESEEVPLVDDKEPSEETTAVAMETKSPIKQENKSAPVATLTFFRRCNMIMEYMEDKRIEHQTHVIIKYIKNKEDKFIDRKTLLRILNSLVARGKLITCQVQLEIRDVTSPIKVYCLSSVGEDEITQFKKTLQDKMIKSQFRQKKIKTDLPSLSASSDEEENNEGDNGDREILEQQMLPKFQRIKHFHYYLWILAHGYESVSAGQNESESPWNGNESGITTFPWMKDVERIPAGEGKSPGAILYCDILYHMPFALMNMLQKPLTNKRLPQKYLKYYNDPIMSNLPIRLLPEKIRKRLSHRNRDRSCIWQLLDWLVDMGLVNATTPSKETSDAIIYLIHDVSILNTSTCLPRRSFFLNEARQMFNQIHHNLTSISDLNQYWSSLENICTSTPIVIGVKKKSSHLSVKDQFALPLNEKIKSKSKASREQLKLLGFGAGGLPIYFFSHTGRNWFHKLGLVSEASGMGMSPAVRAGSQVLTKKLQKGRVAISTGGRGLKRNRAKKALENARKVQKKSKVKIKSTLTSLVPLRGNTAEDQKALSVRVGERSVWNKDEDNFIFLSYIATLVLHKLGHPPTDQSELRNALHHQFESSSGKTALAIHRRLVKLLRLASQQSITQCINEILEGLNVMESLGPEQNFQSLLEFILQRYVSHDGHVINISQKSEGLLLPSKLEDLDEFHDPSVKSLTQLTNQQRHLLNIIISTTSYGQCNKIDSYNVYKVMKTFSEDDIKVAFDCLKSKSYVVKRKFDFKHLRASKSSGTLENRGFALGFNFHQLFEGPYSKDFFQQIKDSHIQSVVHQDELVDLDTVNVNSGDVVYITGNAFCSKISCEPRFPNPLLINVAASASNKLLHSALEEEDEEQLEDEQIRSNTETLNKSLEMIPESSEMIPESSEMINESSEMIPGSSEMIPESSEMIPESSEMITESSEMIPGSSEMIPESSEMINESSDIRSPPVTTSKKDKTPKSGLRVILDIDHEAAHLQHCNLVIRHSAINIGHLLDPLDEEPPVNVEIPQTPSIAPLTFDTFANISSSSLGYSPVTMATAQQVFCLIENASTAGVTMETLTDELKCPKELLSSILHDLVNFNLIVVCSSTTPIYVSHTHYRHWCIDGDNGSMICVHPWIVPEDPIVREYQQGVLTHIMRNPGITLFQLLHYFDLVLQRVDLDIILQNLIAAGCIKRYTLRLTTPIRRSLFDPPTSSVITSCRDDDPPEFVYYEATINAECSWAEQL